jgi:hypothetical protein
MGVRVTQTGFERVNEELVACKQEGNRKSKGLKSSKNTFPDSVPLQEAQGSVLGRRQGFG